jgi:hypothetical protein
MVWCQDESVYGDPAAMAWRENQQIACLQDAKRYGIGNAVLAVGYLLFDSRFNYRGTADLAAFKLRIDALGNTVPTIAAIYPMDEPDMHGIPDATMLKVYSETGAVWQQPSIAVIYGDHGTPGLALAKIVGFDNYPKGASVLNSLPPLLAGQSRILVPGGADPWRTEPAPFLAYANSHPEVSMIVPFMWGCCYSGTHAQGIATNGMAPAYQAVGAAIVGP